MSESNLPHAVQRYSVLREVYEALGLTTLCSRYKGCYSVAFQIAEDACRTSPSHSRSGTRLAAALTSRGIVRMLQGNSSGALQDLHEAVILAKDDPQLQLLAFLYVYQATQAQYTFFPDPGSTAVKDIERRFDSIEELKAWEVRTRHLSSVYAGDPCLSMERDILRLHRNITSFPRDHRPGQDPTFQASQNSLLSVFDTDYNALAARCPDRSALAHLRLLRARVLHRSLRRDGAMHELAVADQLYRQTDDIAGLAEIQLVLGDWLVAPVSSPEVWNSFLAEGTYDTSLNWELDKAEMDVDVERAGEAKGRYDTALRLFEYAKVHRGIGATRLRLGYLDVLKGMRQIHFEEGFAAAKKEIEFSARIFSQVGDVFAFQLSQAQLALCAVGQGEIPEQRERVASIGRWAHRDGSFGFALGIGLFFGRMGWRWINQIGDYERALACFRLAETLFASLGALLSHIHSLIDQLKVYEVVGDFPSCSSTSEQALDECLATKRRWPKLAEDITQLGRWLSLRMLGLASSRAAPQLIEKVRNYIQNIRDNTQDSPSQRPPSSALSALAAMVSQLQISLDAGGSAADAYLKGAEQATGVFLESQLADSEIYQDLYSGRESQKSGDTETARQHFNRVRQRASTFSGSRKDYFDALAFAYEGDYSHAGMAYRRCVEDELGVVDRQVRAGLSTPLDDDRRRQAASRALSFFCEIGQFDEAQRWLSFLGHWPDWWRKEGQEWLSLRRIAQVEEGMGELGSALSKYDKAIRVFESQRQRLSLDELKVAFAGDSSTRALFFDCIRTAVTLRGRPTTSPREAEELEAKVFEIAERNKARSLLDLMGGGMVGRSSSSGSSSALRCWRRLSAYRSSRCGLLEQELRSDKPDQERISILKREITQSAKAIADAERNMSTSGRPARSVTAEVSSLNTVCQALPRDTLVLQYIYDREQLFSWALSHQGMVKLHEQTLPIYWLDRKVKLLHEACKNELQPGSIGLELSHELLEPFHQLIDDSKRLVIVPHNSLHILPFHALPFMNNEPLASSHVVTYLPSASVLRFLVPREKTSKDPCQGQCPSVVAIGNPSNMSFQDAYGHRRPADPLPGTETEVSHIARIMPERTVKVFLGLDATFSNLRDHIRKDCSILHLATHCRLLPEVPLLSSISLANGDECSVLDLLDLQELDADLVVLSACQTGKGVPTAGDDVVGFSRALLAAGARAVLVSLWPVDDNATCQLLRYFYEGVASGQRFADALSKAQESLRKSANETSRSERRIAIPRDLEPEEGDMQPSNYSLPAFWAPFILISG